MCSYATDLSYKLQQSTAVGGLLFSGGRTIHTTISPSGQSLQTDPLQPHADHSHSVWLEHRKPGVRVGGGDQACQSRISKKVSRV